MVRGKTRHREYVDDLPPETWSRLNVSLGLFEGGQDATKTTHPGTDHKQAA